MMSQKEKTCVCVCVCAVADETDRWIDEKWDNDRVSEKKSQRVCTDCVRSCG